MYIVLQDGSKVIRVSEVHTKTLNAAKAKATGIMKDMGYLPATISSDGNWFFSKTNPHWVLRNRWKRMYTSGENHHLFAIIVSSHHPDLDNLVKPDLDNLDGETRDYKNFLETAPLSKMSSIDRAHARAGTYGNKRRG